MQNIIFITNIPSPYRVKFFNEMTKYFNLSVIFEGKKLKGNPFNYIDDRFFLFKYIYINKNFYNRFKFNFNYILFLFKYRKSIFILSNYSSVNNFIQVILLRLIGSRYFYEFDGAIIRNDKFITKIYKKFILSGSTGFFSPSNLTDEYIRVYTKNPNIFRYPFSSLYINDIKKIHFKTQDFYKTEIKEIKILSVGQFIHRKGIDILLKSINLLPKNSNFRLMIIGGKPNEELINLKKNSQFNDKITFMNYLSKVDLDKHYENADIFIIPTREDIWGLVVNEALAKGIPVITSDKCGAGLELIKNSYNGFIFKSEDVSGLSNLILKLINKPEILLEMKNNAIYSIQNFTIENMAKTHKKVLNSIKIKI
jgi:glycosyltransferase involved in cell wall biosynthesis